MPDTTSAPTSTSDQHEHSIRGRVRLVLAVVLIVAFIAVVVDNRDETRIGYVFGEARAPLVVVLLIAGVVGAAIGWLVLHRPSRRHR
jgi:uncharacterized integral membrane protein